MSNILALGTRRRQLTVVLDLRLVRCGIQPDA